MSIDVLIDKMTPCLEEILTGKIFQTTFSIAKIEELEGLQANGWNFDWIDKEMSRCNVYKLQLNDDDVIQGLVAAEVVRGAVHIRLAESAPHNIGNNKKYSGVGGHLFAIAIKLSNAIGFEGHVFFDAKNMKLVNHYSENFGANRIPTRIHIYRMEINEINAQNLLKNYTLEGDLNVR
ncbi:MAG: hypothetical protein LBC73_02630 [Oscillospiraceae bacterium]|jgi:hypothetical protein|nr:hypothetical protein [Oscillospiraceae bacterium]